MTPEQIEAFQTVMAASAANITGTLSPIWSKP
jgi:hypothetical protein